MTLTDRVAKFLLDSHQRTAKAANVSVRDIYQATKHSSTHEYPRTERIFITYNLKVGDVLEAKDPLALMVILNGVVVGPSDKFVVYKTSLSQKSVVLPQKMSDETPPDQLKTILLQYDSFSVEEIDLNDIKSVICLANQFSTVSVLEHCYWITNIAGRLD